MAHAPAARAYLLGDRMADPNNADASRRGRPAVPPFRGPLPGAGGPGTGTPAPRRPTAPPFVAIRPARSDAGTRGGNAGSPPQHQAPAVSAPPSAGERKSGPVWLYTPATDATGAPGGASAGSAVERAAAALERIARRLRAGEVRADGVRNDDGDEVVLATVLTALLHKR